MHFERLTRRVRLQRLTESLDAVSHEAKQTVAESIDVWAELKALTGSEQFRAGREVAEGAAVFYMRYRSDIRPKSWQILDRTDTRVWDIVGQPREIGTREGIEVPVICRE